MCEFTQVEGPCTRCHRARAFIRMCLGFRMSVVRCGLCRSPPHSAQEANRSGATRCDLNTAPKTWCGKRIFETLYATFNGCIRCDRGRSTTSVQHRGWDGARWYGVVRFSEKTWVLREFW